MELPAAVSLVRAPEAVVRSPQQEVVGDEALDLSEVAALEPARLRESAGPGVRPALPVMVVQVHLPNAKDGPAYSSGRRLRSKAWRPELPVLAVLVQALLEQEPPERDGYWLRQEVAAAVEIAWEGVLVFQGPRA